MFKLKLKKYWYLFLKLFLKSKITFYQVIIKDIDKKLDQFKINKIHKIHEKKEGK